jgi:hypothetical protein
MVCHGRTYLFHLTERGHLISQICFLCKFWRFFTAITAHILVFFVLTPCSLVGEYTFPSNILPLYIGPKYLR